MMMKEQMEKESAPERDRKKPNQGTRDVQALAGNAPCGSDRVCCFLPAENERQLT